MNVILYGFAAVGLAFVIPAVALLSIYWLDKRAAKKLKD